ncbi:hypothetical protein MPL3356_270115 [Mesorhizobium plurifarium]|uniref:Uncharacterized protein n=1 Tax=Mesorhizobium plurifarium TaxID=69974 RepID=A0A090DUQ9_MESPL|nr:hypothetical protein MPL3356_270115 [Mesorhizobium plurifarium]
MQAYSRETSGTSTFFPNSFRQGALFCTAPQRRDPYELGMVQIVLDDTSTAHCRHSKWLETVKSSHLRWKTSPIATQRREAAIRFTARLGRSAGNR